MPNENKNPFGAVGGFSLARRRRLPMQPERLQMRRARRLMRREGLLVKRRVK